MKKTTSRIVRQSQFTRLPLAPRARDARDARFALYLTIGLLLLIGAALWVGIARPTAAATPYQTKGSSVETKGDAQLPACAPNWLVESSPNVIVDPNTFFFDVDVFSPTDAWAVGDIDTGSSFRSLIEHWDGTSWNIVPSPNPSTTWNFLHQVAAISANDIWAVGEIALGSGSRTFTLHWNGSVWSTVISPNVGSGGNSLTDVELVSANNVWAVGYFHNGTTYRTLAMRWNGSAWTIVSTPSVGSGRNMLQGLTAVSANDVWAVGDYYDYNANADRTLIQHYNGTTWTTVTSPNQGTGYNYLESVDAVSANNIWAVGHYNDGAVDRTLIQHYNGTTWTTVTSPNVGAENNTLEGITAVSASDVWAAGTYQTGGVPRTLIQRWNGSSWSTIPSPNAGPGNNYLMSVAFGPSNSVWAVGAAEGKALALQWNGTYWNTVPTSHMMEVRNNLFDVDAAAANQVWAVGDHENNHEVSETFIQRWNGSSWSVVPSPNAGSEYKNNKLKGVEAVSANDVWAVGFYEDNTTENNRTLIMRWDGTVWNIVPSPNSGAEDNHLFAVSAISANDVWAVGSYVAGAVNQTLTLHWDGSSWTVVSSPNTGPSHNYLYGVTAISANDVWAVGSFVVGSTFQTLMLRWNGSSWSVVPSPNAGTGSSFLWDVSASSSDNVWAVGAGSGYTLIMRWDGSAWVIVPSPNAGTSLNFLQSVFVVSPTEAWAVGRYSISATARTLIQRWDGSSWNIVASPNTGTDDNYLWGVTVVPGVPTDMWTVGYYQDPLTEQTLVERYNPCTSASPTPTTISPTQTPGGPTATPVACTIEFTDVLPGSTFYDFVQCMACQGIINGYTSGCGTGNSCFRPNSNVTRGQLSKIVSNAAGFSEPVGAPQFEDMPPGSTFFDFVWRLANRGHVSGYACGGPGEPCAPPNNLPYFRPNGNATRGQISKIVANSAGFTDPPGTQLFEDVPPSHTFHDFIQRLASRGVMSGYACGGVGEPCGGGNLPYFRPASNATRGQTSKIVANTFFPNCSTPSK